MKACLHRDVPVSDDIRETLHELQQVAHMDDTVMVREKQRAMRTHVTKMSALFHDADTSGDGRLDIEECLRGNGRRTNMHMIPL